ncbi:hypothetical protein [Actinomadura harenae]|uniref:hypothetical protein n=1 Tax=Actinomadura harenae TaxID=2483351 RepID=UPI0018F44B61|nr:hypothetical protein [Actinomadura harenae]
MSRLVDRFLNRIVPNKVEASACSTGYFCNAGGHPGYWFRFCCLDSGCEWTYIGSC